MSNSKPRQKNWTGGLTIIAMIVVMAIAFFSILVRPMFGDTDAVIDANLPELSLNPLNVALAISFLFLTPITALTLSKLGEPKIVPWMVNLARVPRNYVGKPGEKLIDRREEDRAAVTGWWQLSRIPWHITFSLLATSIALFFPLASIGLMTVYAIGYSWAFWLVESDRQNSITLVWTHTIRRVESARTAIAWIFPNRGKVNISDTETVEAKEVLDSTDVEDLPAYRRAFQSESEEVRKKRKKFQTSNLRDNYTALLGNKDGSNRVGSLLLTSKRDAAGDVLPWVRNPSNLKESIKFAKEYSETLKGMVESRKGEFNKFELPKLLSSGTSTQVDIDEARNDFMASLVESMEPAMVFDSYTGKPIERVNKSRNSTKASTPPGSSPIFPGIRVDAKESVPTPADSTPTNIKRYQSPPISNNDPIT